MEIQIVCAGDLDFIEKVERGILKKGIAEIERMLHALIKSLEKKPLESLVPFLQLNWRRTEKINVYDFPSVQWRWKITSVYRHGEACTKAGDDFPIRIYIMFPYDPANAGLRERLNCALAKKLYGKYAPHSSLNYIWANHRHRDRIIVSPYTDRARMIILETGAVQADSWVTETINILEDYEDAFGKAPPTTARIAVMGDSDNTHEHAISYLDFIELSDKEDENYIVKPLRTVKV